MSQARFMEKEEQVTKGQGKGNGKEREEEADMVSPLFSQK